MKLTESQLRKIIREEISKNVLLEYERAIVRIKGKTYIVDDEGNQTYLDSNPESHGLMEDGESEPYEGGGYGGDRSYGYGRSRSSYGSYGGGYGRYGRRR